MLGQMTCIGIEQEIYARVEKALKHPDNILGQAALLTSLAMSEAEGSNRDFFLNWCIPAAYDFYQPVRFLEPAAGSGRMILGFAINCPE